MRTTLTFIWLTLACWVGFPPGPPYPDRGVILYRLCQRCYGAAGENDMSKRHTETSIRATWTHVVPDTLRFETEGHHANKQTVEIRTRSVQGEFDGETRRIATSDLFQCFWTVETKAELDKRRRSAKRMARAGKEGASELMAQLDSVWRAQVELCSTPGHPRIVAAQAQLDAEAEAEGRREARSEAKASVAEAAAELLG